MRERLREWTRGNESIPEVVKHLQDEGALSTDAFGHILMEFIHTCDIDPSAFGGMVLDVQHGGFDSIARLRVYDRV